MMNNGATKYLYLTSGGWQVRVGKISLGFFPYRLEDLAEKLAEEAGQVDQSSFPQLRDKYERLKRERGVKVRGKRTPDPANGSITHDPDTFPMRPEVGNELPDDVNEQPGAFRVSIEERRLRADFTIGHAVQDVDKSVATLPFLIDQARDAEAKAQKAQAEIGALWAASDRAWGGVADAILSLGSEGLSDALAAALAAKRGGE